MPTPSPYTVPKRALGIRLRQDTIEKLNVVAKRNGVPRAEVARRAIELHVEAQFLLPGEPELPLPVALTAR